MIKFLTSAPSRTLPSPGRPRSIRSALCSEPAPSEPPSASLPPALSLHTALSPFSSSLCLQFLGSSERGARPSKGTDAQTHRVVDILNVFTPMNLHGGSVCYGGGWLVFFFFFFIPHLLCLVVFCFFLPGPQPGNLQLLLLLDSSLLCFEFCLPLLQRSIYEKKKPLLEKRIF